MTGFSVLGRGAQHILVVFGWLLLFGTRSGAVSRCVDQACSPPIGNLASGRSLQIQPKCCVNNSFHQSFCPPETPNLCQEDTHPPYLLTDDPFLYPDTWWASGGGDVQQREIRLDLETKFCLSHVVLVFRSPRPAAMVVERSADFGKTWEALRVFAYDCRLEFDLDDDLSLPGSLCTSRYSSPQPCTGGEVIIRTLDPSGAQTFDPYSPEALIRLTITNLRIRLLKAQTCPVPLNSSAILESPPSAPYAISTFLARGTCLCHGHAEYCLPYNSSEYKTQESDMVFGKCLCVHHTEGDHCERCAPLYNDRPWRPANGSSSEPNPCQSYWGFGDNGCKPCVCPNSCDPATGHCLNRKIPDVDHTFTAEEEASWSKELPVSALYYTGKCRCKEKSLRSFADLCKTKHGYVIKASVLSAHDKGSHAEVRVKVRKVFRSGQVVLHLGTVSVYPLSWTSRGCTCPVLNPGVKYLLAGPEEPGTGRLLVTMQSVAVPWTPRLPSFLSEALRNGCL